MSKPDVGSAITGHCVCGRYTITIPRPKEMNLCHCVDCRRWAGSLYSAHIKADPASAIIFDGPAPREYTVKGVDGNDMTRAWCDECGSGLYIKPGGTEGIQWVKAGLFDPGSIPKPTSEVFLKDMEGWEKPFEGIKHFDANM